MLSKSIDHLEGQLSSRCADRNRYQAEIAKHQAEVDKFKGYLVTINKDIEDYEHAIKLLKINQGIVDRGG